MTVTIKEITSHRELRKFVHFPNELYKDNPYYVPQIEIIDVNTFDPNKNRAFEVCDAKYWLAYDENGKIVGRVAGIINHRYNEKVGEKICRFGWIDFIDSQEVGKALLDTVENFAREQGMEQVEGPDGLLEFDVTGVLVEGFDQIPTPYGKYNDPYYEPRILAEGYEQSTDYVEFLIHIPPVMPEKHARLAGVVRERYGLRQAPLKTKKDILPYLDGVFECMNRCYSSLHGFSELSKGQCDDLLNAFFAFLNPDYVSIILNSEDKVVGFGVLAPDLSRAMQKAGGYLFPFGFIHLLKALKKNDTMDALLVAILPEYQNKGVNALLFEKLLPNCVRDGFDKVESTRELADNIAVQNMWGSLEHKCHKRARTYKKILK